MSDLDNLMTEDYFDESESYSGRIPQGVFPAHITDLNIKTDIKVKSKQQEGMNHLCDIYEFTYKVAPEVKDHNYKIADGKEISGDTFSGKTLKGRGIFKFKSVTAEQANDGYIPNAGGNKRFKNFLDSIGFECETKEITDTRGTRTVIVLPDLMTDDVEGRPVMVTVTHREWKGKQGDTMTAVEVSDTKLWESGKPKKTTMSEEDIPF